MIVEMLTQADLKNFKEELKEDLLKEIKEMIRRPAGRQKEQKEWLKSYEVRAMMGISAGTLQNMRRNKTLPFTRIGGLMYYRYEDVRKLMDGEQKK